MRNQKKIEDHKHFNIPTKTRELEWNKFKEEVDKLIEECINHLKTKYKNVEIVTIKLISDSYETWDEYWKSCFKLYIEFTRLETIEEVQFIEAKIKESKELRRQNYLKLKEEFESEV